jgi:hypothetical protein
MMFALNPERTLSMEISFCGAHSRSTQQACKNIAGKAPIISARAAAAIIAAPLRSSLPFFPSPDLLLRHFNEPYMEKITRTNGDSPRPQSQPILPDVRQQSYFFVPSTDAFGIANCVVSRCTLTSGRIFSADRRSLVNLYPANGMFAATLKGFYI